MPFIPTSIDTLPATVVPQRPTIAKNAWLGPYRTVRLTAPIQALRVHIGAGTGASLYHHLAAGAGLRGRWFAVGDIVHTYDQYLASRALPGQFTEIALATIAALTILNVGYCSPLFGQPGGGEQIEFVEGSAPVLTPISATWSNSVGHA